MAAIYRIRPPHKTCAMCSVPPPIWGYPVSARKVRTRLTVATKLNNEIIIYWTAFSRCTSFHNFRNLRLGCTGHLLLAITSLHKLLLLLYICKIDNLLGYI